MSRTPLKPYLIVKDEEGVFRVTVRTVRYNSQNYPIVTAKTLDEGFKTMSVARAYVRDEFHAQTTDIAIK